MTSRTAGQNSPSPPAFRAGQARGRKIFTFSVFDDTRYAARIGRGLSACGAEDGGDIRRFDVRIFSAFDGGVYIPLFFRFGAEKARVFFIVCFLAATAIVTASMGIAEKAGGENFFLLGLNRRFRLCRGGFYNLLFHIFAYLR